MKKALIISIKAGYGHHSTGQAIMQYMKTKKVDCEMLDTFEYINPHLNNSVSKGYLLTTKYTPEAFGKVYGNLAKKDQRYDKHSFFAILSKIVSSKLKNFIDAYSPDVIIGTHSFACMVMTYLKEKGEITCPTIGIVTDFTVHPFWESTTLDYYVVPDDMLIRQMNKKGIPTKRILPFGIPVHERFSCREEAQEARARLGIDNIPTILVMMGSMGFGNMEKQMEAIDAIDLQFQVLCVCGNNQKMKKEIDRKVWRKKIYTYGFVHNVDELMDASDCIITKPGGLTMSEALAKGIPPIIMNPIPGQEDRNMEFLVNNGAAIMVTETFPVDEAIFYLLHHQWRLDLLKKSIERLGKPESTADLCEFILHKLWGIEEEEEVSR
jgi:processive 1,2-diacylglycerol beta-glucosyltransferase